MQVFDEMRRDHGTEGTLALLEQLRDGVRLVDVEAAGPGAFGHARVGVYAEGGDTRLDELLDQVSVTAAEVDYGAAGC